MKKITVTDCTNCPHADADTDYNDEILYCTHTSAAKHGGMMFDDVAEKPPKWCPLRKPEYENLNFVVKRDSYDMVISRIKIFTKFK